MTENFNGVFMFTNASDEDFVALWNNKEYKFPAQTTCPLIIPDESQNNIQEIRKKFARKFAERELFNSPEGAKLEKSAAKAGIKPATYNESILDKYIQQCLTPLPNAIAEVKETPVKKVSLTEGTAVLGKDGGLQMDRSIDGYVPPTLGKMSDA